MKSSMGTGAESMAVTSCELTLYSVGPSLKQHQSLKQRGFRYFHVIINLLKKSEHVRHKLISCSLK